MPDVDTTLADEWAERIAVHLDGKTLRHRMADAVDDAIAAGVYEPGSIRERVFENVLAPDQRRTRAQERYVDERMAAALTRHHRPPLRDEDAGELQHSAANYAIFDVIADGVVGNAAYDLLKLAIVVAGAEIVHRVRGSRRGRTPAAKDVLESYVRLAVVEQSRRHELPVPQLEELRVSKWEYNRDSATAYVRISGDSSFLAVVDLPDRDLQKHGARVTIRQSNAPIPADDSPRGALWIN